jgi:hypothetical protein
MRQSKFQQLIGACLFGLTLASVVVPATAYAAVVTRGPYLQMASPNAISIRWRTDTATNSRVQFGTVQGSLTNFLDNATVTTEHEVRLTTLNPETKYYYSVGSTTGVLSGNDANTFFKTGPVTGTARPTRIWVIGDAGTGSSSQTAVYNAYLTHTGSTYTNLWLMLGDNAYNSGTDAEYQSKLFNIYPQMLKQSPSWPTIGNHDAGSANSATQTGPYYDNFTMPKNAEAGGIASGTEAYYSYDYGNIHFVVLDSEETSRSTTGAMMNWMKADLQATNAEWIIAFWHHPPYTKGSHNSDSETALIEMRQNFLPELENYGVDLVLTGHSHSYERSFLLDGHYGSSSTFTSAHQKNAGNGRVDGAGAYAKNAGNIPHEGAVYVVAGSSGQISGGTLNHPAMYLSLNELGSMVLDIDGQTLNAKFLNSTGATRDYFTIVKGATTGSCTLPWGGTLASGSSTTAYQTSSSSNCPGVAETRTCTNGVLSGSYTYQSCSTPAASCTLPWGGTIASGSNVTAYQTNSSTNCPGVAQTRTCTDGTLSGTYTYQSCSAPTGTVTVSLQNGLNSYTGNDDTHVASKKGSTNYGTATTLKNDLNDSTYGNEYSLLKWTVSSIPAAATVQTVDLGLTVSNASAGTYNLYQYNKAWVESTATWSNQTPDSYLGPLVGTVLATSTGTKTIALNAAGVAMVQGWVNGTVVNNGLLLKSASTTDGLDVRSSEYATQASRPKLTIQYAQ